MSPTTDEQTAYYRQRMLEEQAKAAKTSCIVRSVHRDFAEAYQEKIAKNELELHGMATRSQGELQNRGERTTHHN